MQLYIIHQEGPGRDNPKLTPPVCTPLFFLHLSNTSGKMSSLGEVKEHRCQIGIKLC